MIQRFGGALNLNVHIHALVLDGVFASHGAGALSFHPTRRLTTLDVAEVLATVEPLVTRRLQRRGRGDGDDDGSASDAWADEAPVLAGLAVASVQGTVALGARRGVRLRRLGDAAEPVEAPRAAWRAEVVRRPMSGDGRDAGLKTSATEPAREADAAETARRQARGQHWASLMARTFGFDVLACPRCGGRLRVTALITEAAVINRILKHLGVPTEIPARRPARAPPRLVTGRDGAGWNDDTPVFESWS